MPKTLTGLVNALDRSYAAVGESTRVFTGLKMGRKLLFTMNCEIFIIIKYGAILYDCFCTYRNGFESPFFVQWLQVNACASDGQIDSKRRLEFGISSIPATFETRRIVYPDKSMAPCVCEGEYYIKQQISCSN